MSRSKAVNATVVQQPAAPVEAPDIGTNLARARSAAKRGLPVFPLRPGTKLPAISEWQKRATTNDEQIQQWAKQFPGCGFGLHCDGLLTVDIDVKNGAKGYESLLRLELDYGGLPATCQQTTPSGGQHLLFSAPHDIPNTVGKLGPGLDTRGKRGYIVAYGMSDTPLAPAPQWLIDLAGKAREKADGPAIVGTDNPTDVTRAVNLLAEAAPAEEGDGGDAYTFALVCKVRDMGLSASTTLDLLLEHWNERCLPPWEHHELEQKVVNAYRYAQNALGVNSVEAMFQPIAPLGQPAANEQTPEADLPQRRVIRQGRSLEKMAPGPALWEGVIPERGVFAIGALPGRSKSETATNLAYAIGTDAGAFLGRKLPTGTAAVYVDAERMEATELRLAVFCRTDGREPEEVGFWLTNGVILSRPDSVKELIQALLNVRERIGRRISLVILDSLGATLAGEDTNGAGPASMAGTQLRRIRDSVNCAVGVVAHSPKSGEETVAGSLQFDAIFDTTVFVRSDDATKGATGTLYVKKSNAIVQASEAEREIAWKAEVLVAEFEGRPVKARRPVAGVPRPKGAAPVEERLSGRAGMAWAVQKQVSPRNEPISHEAWKAACQKVYPEKFEGNAFADAKYKLVRLNLVVVDEEGLIRRRETSAAADFEVVQLGHAEPSQPS